MYPGSKGGHARDSMKYGITTSAGVMKAEILEFQGKCGAVSVMKVMYAYMHR